jgi:hypothetical protein
MEVYTNLRAMHSRLKGTRPSEFDQFRLGFLAALAHTNQLVRQGAVPAFCSRPVSTMIMLTVEWANMPFDAKPSKIEREKR